MKRYLRLFLLPLASLLTACSSDPVDTTGSISGIVKDAITKATLQGATVSIEGFGSKITGTDGRYEFTDVEMGTYKVAVNCANYVDNEQTVVVRVGETTTADFNLNRAASALVVTPLSLDFGELDNDLAVDIKNNGQGIMTWQITESLQWLTCSHTSGTIQAGRQTSVTFTVNRAGLSKGSYTGNVVVTSDDGGSQTIRVSMSVGAGDTALPQVSLISVGGVTDVAASFKGTLVSVGSSRVTRHGFCWSTTRNPSLEQGSHKDLGEANEPKEFTYSVPDLQPTTTYFVRAYATNAEGTVYSSNELSFTTTATPQPPKVETGAATQLTANSAVVAGTILALGHEAGITQYGHVWSSETKEPTLDYSKTELGTTKQTGSFNSTLNGLKPGTTYYVRAYARNAWGLRYADNITQFTTPLGTVQLTTQTVTDIIHNEATSGGRITDLQGHTIRERGVCWSTGVNPTIAHSHAASTQQTDNFTARLTGLAEQTTYHVRAYVTTATGETFYGQDVQFKTTGVITVPVLSAVSVNSITSKKATFTAKVTSTGGGTLKRTGFCFATTHNPTTGHHQLNCGTATSLQATATGLSPQTTYYVRAFAENEKGLEYGPEQTFTTKEPGPDEDIQNYEWENDQNWN